VPASTGRYAWTGRERETETGLQYNRARYYDPATGRWVSQDPIGYSGGDNNLYRYVNNHPTITTDSSGLQEKPVFRRNLVGTDYSNRIVKYNMINQQQLKAAYDFLFRLEKEPLGLGSYTDFNFTNFPEGEFRYRIRVTQADLPKAPEYLRDLVPDWDWLN